MNDPVTPITDEQVNAAQAAYYAAATGGKSWESYLAGHPRGAAVREQANAKMRLDLARAAAVKAALQ